MTPTKEDVDDILYLLKRSEYHRWWGIDEINNLIRTPLQLNQYFIIRDEGRIPVVFATWALPSHDHVVEYVQDLQFPAEGYNGGGDIPWIVDFIAEGGKANIALGFRKTKSVLSSRGYNQAFWLRTETQKLGFYRWS